ncbi:MAG: 50S ribosome-binding GTPase, partial [Thermoguttaceae bacterium]|nr:50S ribosome-binding GTPase [Thermoguttaceae bacterium]
MGVAKVAIIGRPNVGKSSIFNWLIGERVSIVDSVAGVTRDRVSFLLDIGLEGVDEKYLVPEVVSNRSEDGDDDSDAFGSEGGELLDFVDEDVPIDQEGAVDGPDFSEQDSEHNSGDGDSEDDAEFVEADEFSFDDEEDEEGSSDVPKISARYIELTDSGGIGIVDKDDLSEDVEQQIQAAIDLADLILFVVDARDGLAPLDEYVAERLRKLRIPIILVANKCDGGNQEYDSQEFHRFGWDVVPVSAKQKRGRVALMDAIEKALPVSAFFDDGKDVSEPEMKIAIVGRR